MGSIRSLSRRICHSSGSECPADRPAPSPLLPMFGVLGSGTCPIILWHTCRGLLTYALQGQYYGKKRPLRVCVGMLAGLIVLLGGFEVGMVYAIRVSIIPPQLKRLTRCICTSTCFIAIIPCREQTSRPILRNHELHSALCRALVSPLI